MKQLILSRITDLVANFLYYDRKTDEELSHSDLMAMIESKIITEEEINAAFAMAMKRYVNNLETANATYNSLKDSTIITPAPATQENKWKYTYFVSYSGGGTTGRIILDRNTLIDSTQEIESVESVIERERTHSVCITNFILLKTNY